MGISLSRVRPRPSEARVLRYIAGAARRLQRASWDLRAQWYRVRGEEAAARALLTAPPGLAERILRALGASIGRGTSLRPPIHVLNPQAGFCHLSIGREVWVGPDVLLDLKAPIEIRDRATLSARTAIVTHLDVGASRLARSFPREAAPVVIDEDAYLGTGATVLHGIHIGAGALIAASALVNASVAADTLVAGVPARPIREIA